MEEFKKWLGAELEALQLEMGTQGMYILAILEDDMTSLRQKRVDIIEFLVASIPDDPALEQLGIEVMNRWKVIETDRLAKEREDRENNQVDDPFENLSELLEVKDGDDAVDDNPRNLTEEELRHRNYVLQNYTYEEEDVEDDSDGDDGFVNDNAERVKEKQAQFREENKAAHEAKVQRDKEALKKDKENKEALKEKRKPVKKEKRRM
tara:strand:+ start:698 stop:1318 length:621 start_codon:yes stop_codon:yes gene_type:complete